MIVPAAMRSRRRAPSRRVCRADKFPHVSKSTLVARVADRHPAWLPWGNFSDHAAIAGSAGTVGRAAVRSDHRVLLGHVHTGVKENRPEQCDYFFYFFSKQDLVPSTSRTKPYQLSLGRRRGSSLYVDGRIRCPRDTDRSPSLAPDMIFILRPLPALPTPLTAIERWRSGCPWPATMDHTHSAADRLRFHPCITETHEHAQCSGVLITVDHWLITY